MPGDGFVPPALRPLPRPGTPPPLHPEIFVALFGKSMEAVPFVQAELAELATREQDLLRIEERLRRREANVQKEERHLQLKRGTPRRRRNPCRDSDAQQVAIRARVASLEERAQRCLQELEAGYEERCRHREALQEERLQRHEEELQEEVARVRRRGDELLAESERRLAVDRRHVVDELATRGDRLIASPGAGPPPRLMAAVPAEGPSLQQQVALATRSRGETAGRREATLAERRAALAEREAALAVRETRFAERVAVLAEGEERVRVAELELQRDAEPSADPAWQQEVESHMRHITANLAKRKEDAIQERRAALAEQWEHLRENAGGKQNCQEAIGGHEAAAAAATGIIECSGGCGEDCEPHGSLASSSSSSDSLPMKPVAARPSLDGLPPITLAWEETEQALSAAGLSDDSKEGEGGEFAERLFHWGPHTPGGDGSSCLELLQAHRADPEARQLFREPMAWIVDIADWPRTGGSQPGQSPADLGRRRAASAQRKAERSKATQKERQRRAVETHCQRMAERAASPAARRSLAGCQHAMSNLRSHLPAGAGACAIGGGAQAQQSLRSR